MLLNTSLSMNEASMLIELAPLESWAVASVSERGVRRLRFLPEPPDEAPSQAKTPPWAAEQFARLEAQLREYLAGERSEFDLTLDPPSMSSFAASVLMATAHIPYGQTRTYGQVARQIGRPTAARAVGQALAANPLPILIPCHRVLAGDGSLRGYSAPGGIALKQRLLTLEMLRRNCA